MKKVLFAAAAMLLMFSSCSTVKKTASSIDVANSLTSQSLTDLEVSNTRISYSFRPDAKERRGGVANVKACAVSAALKANGGADVLVAPEFEVVIKRGLMGSKVKEVNVTGYPAKYKNFRIQK